jgi:hypothetical protein
MALAKERDLKCFIIGSLFAVGERGRSRHCRFIKKQT